MATEAVRNHNTPGANGSPGHSAKKGRRRRVTAGLARVRYFLPQSGSNPERPELAQEGASEREALVEALKPGQVFYRVIAWRAVPERNGTEAKIAKQPFSSA
jgi:hypothetical protein